MPTHWNISTQDAGIFATFPLESLTNVVYTFYSGNARSLWMGVAWALTSGSGVALALLLGASGPLIGVAISASLLPPVVNCVSILSTFLAISIFMCFSWASSVLGVEYGQYSNDDEKSDACCSRFIVCMVSIAYFQMEITIESIHCWMLFAAIMRVYHTKAEQVSKQPLRSNKCNSSGLYTKYWWDSLHLTSHYPYISVPIRCNRPFVNSSINKQNNNSSRHITFLMRCSKIIFSISGWMEESPIIHQIKFDVMHPPFFECSVRFYRLIWRLQAAVTPEIFNLGCSVFGKWGMWSVWSFSPLNAYVRV